MSHNQKKPDAKAIPDKNYRGHRARAGNQTLRSWRVGGLPIVNRLLDRMRLEAFLERHLPPDDPRQEVPTTRSLLLLLRNILLSREPPISSESGGIGEWAESYAPDLLGLKSSELKQLNDDRIGRCLDRLFGAPIPELLLEVVRHVIGEFGLRLDELHNDSTTLSCFGAYHEASEELSPAVVPQQTEGRAGRGRTGRRDRPHTARVGEAAGALALAPDPVSRPGQGRASGR